LQVENEFEIIKLLPSLRMIVSVEKYKEMLSCIDSALRNGVSASIDDAMRLNVPFDSLTSLCGQVYVRKYCRLSKAPVKKVISSSMEDLKSGRKHISTLIADNNMLVGKHNIAKWVLEELFDNKDFETKEFLSNPFIVECNVLRLELLRFFAQDSGCSPEIDLLKERSGTSYEALLTSLLQYYHMSFETEAEMRKKGKPKTPDVRFTIPMAVKVTTKVSMQQRADQDQYTVVNWIDSKATFADAETFAENLSQFKAYYARYGRGMVIYWHGFVENIFEQIEDFGDNIIICDTFPEEWIFPNGEPADGRIPSYQPHRIGETFGTVNEE
jgi:hypothetical protein